jgi:hypothetical protein
MDRPQERENEKHKSSIYARAVKWILGYPRRSSGTGPKHTHIRPSQSLTYRTAAWLLPASAGSQKAAPWARAGGESAQP